MNEGGFPVKEFYKISFRTGKPYPYTTISQSWTNGQCFWCVKLIFSPRRTRCTLIDFGKWFQDNFHLTIRSLRNPSQTWRDIKLSASIFRLFSVGTLGTPKNWKHRFLVNLVVDMAFPLERWNMFVDLLAETVSLCFKYINRPSTLCCHAHTILRGT